MTGCRYSYQALSAGSSMHSRACDAGLVAGLLGEVQKVMVTLLSHCGCSGGRRLSYGESRIVWLRHMKRESTWGRVHEGDAPEGVLQLRGSRCMR